MELLKVVEDRTAAIHITRKRKDKKKQVKIPESPVQADQEQDDFLGKLHSPCIFRLPFAFIHISGFSNYKIPLGLFYL